MGMFGSFFGEKREETQMVSSALDLVTYVATLVSNQDAIGTVLDKVRTVTARMVPPAGLSAQDETELLKVYLQLESYLTTREAIRAFSKDELRKRIAQPLQARLAEVEAAKPTVKAQSAMVH